MSATTYRPEPFADIVEESLDEAAFLWRRWEHELSSLTRNLDEVWSWTEDRLHGALDGVRVGGCRSDVVMNALLSADLDRVTVAMAVLASPTEAGAGGTVADALAAAKGDRLRAMIRGLELLGSDEALRAAASVLNPNEPEFAGALCRLKAFRRVAPGVEMRAALSFDTPDARLEAVRAAVHLPEGRGERAIAGALHESDAKVRSAAVEAGLVRGMPEAWTVAQRIGQQHDPAAGPYLRLLAMLGGQVDQEIVYAALRVPALQTHAIWALGHIGDVRAVEACLAGMAYENLARACGEAYCCITGADLDRDRLAVQEVPPDLPAFEDDDLDANLVPPPEALWPLPDAEAVRRDWAARCAGFTPEVRHVRGQPANGETLMATVEGGPALRRHDLAFELRAKSRGRYDVETRAFAARQRQMMAAARAAVSARPGD